MTKPIMHLTEEEIVAINKKWCQKTNLGFGLRTQALENIVWTTKNRFNFKTKKLSISYKAGHLLKSIIEKHPFVDGNKKTALVAAETFLHANDFYLKAGDKEFALLALKTAQTKTTVKKIAIWIRRRLP